MLRVDSSLSSADIKDIIMRSADIVPDLYDNNVAGGRRLNAYRAVKLALGSTTVQLDPLPTLATGTNPLTTSLSTPTNSDNDGDDDDTGGGDDDNTGDDDTDDDDDDTEIPDGGSDSDGDGLIEIVTACLLYTSPSPRDRTRSRMPSSA